MSDLSLKPTDSKITISNKINKMIDEKTCLSLNELLKFDNEVLESLIFVKLEFENLRVLNESTKDTYL